MPKSLLPPFVSRRAPLVFFSLFYFLFAALTYRDYGETWDESGVYVRGMVLGHYLATGGPASLLHPAAPDDGLVLYDHAYALLLSWLNPGAGIDAYHWLNLAFGFLLFAAAYEVLLAQTGRPWGALLGPLFLFLTPRLTGALPADPKDGPFAVLYFLSLAAVFLGRGRFAPSLPRSLGLGLLFGAALTQRLLGFTLFLLWPLEEWLSRPKALRRPGAFLKKMIPAWGLALLAANLLLAATWPYLRADYLPRLAGLLATARHFPWSSQVLFLGREVPAPQLSPAYLPVYLLVTTPLLLLGWCLYSFREAREPRPLWRLLALSLGLNLSAYFLLRPVVYDGLRHFLFLLPLVAVMAALGLLGFLAGPRRPWRRPLLALSAVLAGLVLADMARLHPYEYIYFNELIGGLKGAQGRFETDYWGASYKEAVEWVESSRPPGASPVRVGALADPWQVGAYLNAHTLWADDPAKADYYLAITRDGRDKKADPSRIVHVVEREGVPLCYVFKLK